VAGAGSGRAAGTDPYFPVGCTAGVSLDTSAQVCDHEAAGWQRGLYDDIKRTFRAPFVNWIFRTAMANEPAFLRYTWGQVAPVFDTRAFAQFSVDYRDAVLTELEVPVHEGRDLDLRPPEYRELQGQLATFDIVGPRLAVLFRTLARTPDCERVGGAAGGVDSTAPYPAALDRDRGREPTMVGPGEIPRERRRRWRRSGRPTTSATGFRASTGVSRSGRPPSTPGGWR
jgi:hypothetical protein